MAMTIAEIQAQITKYEGLLAQTPKTSPMYGSYAAILNNFKTLLASQQGTAAPTPVVAPPLPGAGILGQVKDYIQANQPVPTPTPVSKVNTAGPIVADPMLKVATGAINTIVGSRTPAYQTVPDIGGNTGTYPTTLTPGKLPWQMPTNSTPTPTNWQPWAPMTPTQVSTTQENWQGVPYEFNVEPIYTPPAGVGAGGAGGGGTVGGGTTHTCPTGQHWDETSQACVIDTPAAITTPTSPYGSSPSGKGHFSQDPDDTDVWYWNPETETLSDGSTGFYQYDLSSNSWYWVPTTSSPSTPTTGGKTPEEIAADIANTVADTAYKNAITAGLSVSQANDAAQLAWEKENAATQLAASQAQWAQQLQWYKDQQAAEIAQQQKEAEDARRKWLSELAANPRDWIKYNLATTDQAGGVPSWLSKLYEGKVQSGASLDTAKAQNYFPALSKTWYNWMTPSERSMMEGYLSYAGTEPSDYWGNLWWMRGTKPQGAPKVAAFEQK